MIKRAAPLACLLASLVAGGPACTPQQVRNEDSAPPPPQNLLGSTDDLQLVAELSLDLAKTYGGSKILILLEVDDTLLIAADEGPCPGRAMNTLQENAAEQVKRLQDAGLKVMVMSSRAPDCLDRTMMELGDGGFDFSNSSWPPIEGWSASEFPADTVYRDGVFLIDGQDPGEMLETLLSTSDAPWPTLVVLADASQDDLNRTMKIFSWKETKVHAWRYTRATPPSE